MRVDAFLVSIIILLVLDAMAMIAVMVYQNVTMPLCHHMI